MNPYGFNLTFGQQASNCASLTTEAQRRGTYGLLLHQFAGPDVQRHLHGYAELTPEGVMIWGGARLKENTGTHLGPGIVLSHTTQEVARFRVERRDTGVACQLSQWLDGDWVTTTPSTFAKPVTRRPIQLPGAQGITGGEYSLAMFDARSVPEVPPGVIVLPFSGPVPFGLTVTLLKTW